MSNANYHFCGVTERQIAEARRRRAGLLKWNKTDLKWFIADRLPGLSVNDLTAAYAEAFAGWQAVCGLEFSQTLNHRDADFLILSRAIDGANGTLAEHQLPPGDDRTLRGWFDVGEKFDIGPPIPRGYVDLVAVACHEFGHGIGIDHLRPDGNLMNPFYNPAIRRPQRDDIAEAVRRYGPPITDPAAPVPPDPAPPAGDALKLTIETAGGVLYGPLLLPRYDG